MLGKLIYVGGALLTGVGSAHAQTAEAPRPIAPRLASVDGNGRIRPPDQIKQSSDVMRTAVTGDIEAPCPTAKAMPIAAAQALVHRIALEEHFDPSLAQSVAKVSSGYVSTLVSANGAYGLMQLMPDTVLQLHIDVCAPDANVRGGIRTLSTLQTRYGTLAFALAAYIAGDDAVEKARGVPADAETVRFIADVLNDLGHTDTEAKLNQPSSGDTVQRAELPSTPSPKAMKPTAFPDWSDGFVMHVQ